MILLDYSNITHATLFASLAGHSNLEVDENLLRHMVLNTIRANRMKFKDTYGDLVICCDDSHYWRKDLFPYYKANRKKSRAESSLDWDSIFVSLNKIREEVKQNLPYKTIQVPGAEADDIIAVLSDLNKGEAVLIVSGDRDFQQLQSNLDVKQYSPILKKWIVCSDPTLFLKEHIIKGDPGDGIPNILSPDNCLVIGQKQRSVTKGKLEKWLKQDILGNDALHRNFSRNTQLIDFEFIPQPIAEETIRQFREVKVPPRSGLYEYFMEHRLRGMLENLTDF